jgi:hypothetical protein
VQIIIVQAEIETAIRNHILSQINVREGMEISVDLAATRGAEGFKATIDIVPCKNPTSINPVQVPAPVVSTPTQPVAQPQVKQDTVMAFPVRAQAEPQVQAEPVQEVAEAKAEAPWEEERPRIEPQPAEAEPAAQEASEEGSSGAAPQESRPGGRALFKSLRKPSNS